MNNLFPVITPDHWRKSIKMSRNEPNLVRQAISVQRLKSIELLCMAHRYLYYVKCRPVISDHDYDTLEREALEFVGQESLIRQPGSDNEKDYPEDAIELAEKL